MKKAFGFDEMQCKKMLHVAIFSALQNVTNIFIRKKRRSSADLTASDLFKWSRLKSEIYDKNLRRPLNLKVASKHNICHFESLPSTLHYILCQNKTYIKNSVDKNAFIINARI